MIFDKTLLHDFDGVIDEDEEIINIIKPKLIPYILSGIGFGSLAFLIGVFWIVLNFNSNETGIGNNKFFWIFGLLPLLHGIYSIINRIVSYKNTSYAYSNKGIIIRTGFVSINYKTINYSSISQLEVTINFIEKVYNVGTIKFFSGAVDTYDGSYIKIYDSLVAIPKQYEVFKVLNAKINSKNNFGTFS